mgnify:CR=1 FL=1
MDQQAGRAKNPYPYRSIPWALMEEDWSDLTVSQIAEVFGEEVEPRDIRRYIAAIEKRTGYVVPFRRSRAGRKPKG